jgi:hypothetical protein
MSGEPTSMAVMQGWQSKHLQCPLSSTPEDPPEQREQKRDAHLGETD